MVLDDRKIKLKDFLNAGLFFNLDMVSESQVQKWLLRNFPKDNSKKKCYIEHEKGSDVFTIRSAHENSKLIKELIKRKKEVDLLIC